MTRGLPSRLVVWGGLPPDVLATVAAAARARDIPISVYDQIYGGDPERRDPSPLRSIAPSQSLVLDGEKTFMPEMRPGDLWFGAIKIGDAGADCSRRRGVEVYDADELPTLLRRIGGPVYRHGNDDLRDAGAHPTVDNLRALAGLPPTSDTIGPAPYEIEETETRVSIHLRLYVLTRTGRLAAASVRYEKPFAGLEAIDARAVGTTEFCTHRLSVDTPEIARAIAAGLLELHARAAAAIERFRVAAAAPAALPLPRYPRLMIVSEAKLRAYVARAFVIPPDSERVDAVIESLVPDRRDGAIYASNRDTLAALLACDPFAAGLPGHYPLRVGECDHCGFVTVLHDITEYPHGDRRRLASCVGYHCAACCDAHPCDERGRGEAAFDFTDSRSIRRRLSTKLVYPPSIVFRTREHCLACRAVAAGVVPAISVVEHPNRIAHRIVFFCDEDHGCPSCGCVEAAHNPRTTFRGTRDDILARAHVPAGAVRTLGPCLRCDCAGGTYDLGDVGPDPRPDPKPDPRPLP